MQAAIADGARRRVPEDSAPMSKSSAFRTSCLAAVLLTAAAPFEASAAERASLRDPQDGRLDLSAFLDTAYGFVPLVAPITEPAVGYGAVGALVFIDRKEPAAGQKFTRPNIAAVGGLATENGTKGWFAGHLGTWREGRLRTQVAAADADLNLEFFGLGTSGGQADAGVEYTVAASGGVAGGAWRIGDGPFWLGLRYALVRTLVTLRDPPQPGQPEVPAPDLDLRLAGLTPALTVDTRDNFFTPTRGWYLDLSAPVFRESLGGSRDFELATLQAMYYRPLGESLYFGVRSAGKASSDGTPFYLRPFVSLRGVQALRYQGEETVEAEAELRWQFHPRFSLVGFGGGGMARTEVAGRRRERSVAAGGAGFRYLVARTYGLHLGLDVAWGPDEPVFYVVFGSPWLRP
jgi:Omp85 superfamily domain